MNRVTDIVNRAMARVRWEWATRSLRTPRRPDDCEIHKGLGVAAAVVGSGTSAFVLGQASSAFADDRNGTSATGTLYSYAIPFALGTGVPGAGVVLHKRWYKGCIARWRASLPPLSVPESHAQTIKEHPVATLRSETWTVPQPNPDVVVPVATVGILTYLGYFLLSAADAGATVLGGVFAPALRYMPTFDDQERNAIL